MDQHEATIKEAFSYLRQLLDNKDATHVLYQSDTERGGSR